MISYKEITASTEHQLLTINTQSWKIMGQGDGHIILENINPTDPLFFKVISICKHKIDSLPNQF